MLTSRHVVWALSASIVIGASSPCSAQEGFFGYFLSEFVLPAHSGQSPHFQNAQRIDATSFILETPFGRMELYKPDGGDGFVVTSLRLFSIAETGKATTLSEEQSAVASSLPEVVAIKEDFETWLASADGFAISATCTYSSESPVIHSEYGRVVHFQAQSGKHGLLILDIALLDRHYGDASQGQDAQVTTMLMSADKFTCLQGS